MNLTHVNTYQVVTSGQNFSVNGTRQPLRKKKQAVNLQFCIKKTGMSTALLFFVKSGVNKAMVSADNLNIFQYTSRRFRRRSSVNHAIRM